MLVMRAGGRSQVPALPAWGRHPAPGRPRPCKGVRAGARLLPGYGVALCAWPAHLAGKLPAEPLAA